MVSTPNVPDGDDGRANGAAGPGRTQASGRHEADGTVGRHEADGSVDGTVGGRVSVADLDGRVSVADLDGRGPDGRAADGHGPDGRAADVSSSDQHTDGRESPDQGSSGSQSSGQGSDDDADAGGGGGQQPQHWHHKLFSPYFLAVALSLLALSPFIILTTATEALSTLIGTDLHASPTVLEVSSGLANAGYALGAVVAADFAQRFTQRYLFLIYEAVFVLASLLAAFAPDIQLYVLGHLLQGMSTGLLLVSALPPLILRFPAAKMPLTVAFVNIGLFGATALGPFLGNLFLDLGQWRWLFVAVAVLGALGLLAGYLGYEIFPPMNPDLVVDKFAFPLAIGGTFLPFIGSALATSVGFTGPAFWAPLTVGVLSLLGLIVYEYHRRKDPLIPVRALSSSLPVAGTLAAMLGGGAFVAALSLIAMAQEALKVPILLAGAELLPLIAGVALSSVLFRRFVGHAFLPVLAASGLVAIIIGLGVSLLLTFSSDPTWVVPVAAALLGYGAGTSVAPALFLAAMGVEAKTIGRAFALVELLRSEAAFLIAPILVVLTTHIGGIGGIREAMIISLIIAVIGLVFGVSVYVGSGVRRHPPALADWLGGDVPALHSPPLFARLRGERRTHPPQHLLDH